MSELLGTTVEDLIKTMKDRRVRIPSEIGAFIALEVCEGLVEGPAAVRPADIRVAEDGSISVFAPPGSATSEDAARGVVAMLGSLLVAAGTGVPRALVGLLEAGPSSGRWDLSSLRDDLEASLVPLNRAAARRVLGRMLREARKPRSMIPSSAPSEAPPGDPTLDAQLDDLLGGDLDDPDDTYSNARANADADLDAELDATLAGLDDPPPRREEVVPPSDATIAEDSPSLDARKVRSDAPTAPPPAAEPSGPPAGLDLERLGAELDRPKRTSVLPWILAFVAIIAATSAAFALLRPDLIDAALGRPPAPPAPEGPTAEERAAERRAQLGRFGTLTVSATPEQSQVLMFVGRGPAQAEDLPVGMAHEFVVIADDRTPTRSFIPADAEWEVVEGGRRYELALQAGTGEMSGDDLELGDTTLPRDALGAPGVELGTARIITNPPGAKVYLLIGFSPSVTVENVQTREVIELLVYHEGHPVRTVLVSPSDWVENEDGTKRAEIQTTLEGAE